MDVAKAYAGNRRYERYVAGDLNVDKLGKDEIVDLMKKVEKNRVDSKIGTVGGMVTDVKE
ncbi:hypothetical protein HY792_03510 [Candidatus Desantisbacteria bacterium]|nr:hypothetical protein [Candidatus Desantisbacteria bacterium]